VIEFQLAGYAIVKEWCKGDHMKTNFPLTNPTTYDYWKKEFFVKHQGKTCTLQLVFDEKNDADYGNELLLKHSRSSRYDMIMEMHLYKYSIIREWCSSTQN